VLCSAAGAALQSARVFAHTQAISTGPHVKSFHTTERVLQAFPTIGKCLPKSNTSKPARGNGCSCAL